MLLLHTQMVVSSDSRAAIALTDNDKDEQRETKSAESSQELRRNIAHGETRDYTHTHRVRSSVLEATEYDALNAELLCQCAFLIVRCVATQGIRYVHVATTEFGVYGVCALRNVSDYGLLQICMPEQSPRAACARVRRAREYMRCEAESRRLRRRCRYGDWSRYPYLRTGAPPMTRRIRN